MFYSQTRYPNVGQLFEWLEKFYDSIVKHIDGMTDSQLSAINSVLSITPGEGNNGTTYCLRAPFEYSELYSGHMEMTLEPDKKRLRVVEVYDDDEGTPVAQEKLLSATVSKDNFDMKYRRGATDLTLVSTAKTGSVAQRGFDVSCGGRNMLDGQPVEGTLEHMSMMFTSLTKELDVFAKNVGLKCRIIFPNVNRSFAERVAGMTNPYRGR